jgi:ribonuclease HII
MPHFNFEIEVLKKHKASCVCGADEVGRGCLAGPVVAGACVFTPNAKSQLPKFKENNQTIIINDSKRLTASQRERSAKWITENALAWGIGVASVSEINKLGIVKATHKAYRRAIANANTRLQGTLGRNSKVVRYKPYSIDYLLVDAFYIPHVKGLPRRSQNPIIKGDQQSVSIAAASIIAKVYRDSYMLNLSTRHPQYYWHTNKGYGTKKHRDAILTHNRTSHHRKQFVETALRNSR